MKSLPETIGLAEGQIIALNSHLKEKAKTDYSYAIIDQIKGRTVDATFIPDADAIGKPVNRLELKELNLQFFFVYPDIHL